MIGLTFVRPKQSCYNPHWFEEIKDEIACAGSPGVRVLCPTRWAVRADSMMSIIQNYKVQNGLWDKACEIVKDTDTIA